MMLRNMIGDRIIKAASQGIRYSSNWQEIKIPVPWGHVSGKWWGPLDKRPIFASHGWQDNSGTFDTLFPLLPKDTSILAVDFPGCGYSSQLPPGVFYHVLDLSILIRKIVKYFNWPKVSLLGHSLGAAVNYMYCMKYFKEVDFLISLDVLVPLIQLTEVQRLPRDIDDFVKLDSLNTMNNPPCFTFHEMEQKMHDSLKSVSLDACKYILKRNLKPSSEDPNKYYSTVDPRLKVLKIQSYTPKAILENAHRFTFPIFHTRAHQSQFYDIKEYVLEVIKIIKNNNQNFEMHHVEGTHHVHLNNPNCLEMSLNEFLRKYDVVDRSKSGLKQENLV